MKLRRLKTYELSNETTDVGGFWSYSEKKRKYVDRETETLQFFDEETKFWENVPSEVKVYDFS